MKIRKFQKKDLKEVIKLIQKNLEEVNFKSYPKNIIEILQKSYSELQTLKKDYRIVVENETKNISLCCA